MQLKKINILQAVAFILLSLNLTCGAYEEFYYRDKGELESRLVDCLKQWPGILVNYPQALNPKDAAIEADLVLRYGVNATVDSVINDSKTACLKDDYFGLVMICASILNDKEGAEIKNAFIYLAKENLGDNKYKNAIIAFCVKIVIEKTLLTQEGLANRNHLRAIYSFVSDLRLKGFDDKGYKCLVGLDNKIIETCFLEIMR